MMKFTLEYVIIIACSILLTGNLIMSIWYNIQINIGICLSMLSTILMIIAMVLSIRHKKKPL